MKKYLLKIFFFCILFLLPSCEEKKSIYTPIINNSIPNTPFPVDKSTQIPLDITLLWECENALKYNVYFDTLNPPMHLLKGNIEEENCKTRDMRYNTKYYWSVNAYFENGDSTKSEIWNFISNDISIDSSSRLIFNLPKVELIAEEYYHEFFYGGDTTARIDTIQMFTEDYIFFTFNTSNFNNVTYNNDTVHFVFDTSLTTSSMLIEGWIKLNFKNMTTDMYYHKKYSKNEFSLGGSSFDIDFIIKKTPFYLTEENNIHLNIDFNSFINNLEIFSYSEYHKSFTSIGAFIKERYLTSIELLNFKNNEEINICLNF